MQVQEAKTTNELTEDELDQVSAGKLNRFVQFGDIKGESTEKDHKDW